MMRRNETNASQKTSVNKKASFIATVAAAAAVVAAASSNSPTTLAVVAEARFGFGGIPQHIPRTPPKMMTDRSNNNKKKEETSASSSGGLHFILSADDGTYSGTHEQKFVLEKTTITRNFTLEVPFCQSALMGTIDVSKQMKEGAGAGGGGKVDAILVTTGIGAVTAALCTKQAAEWVVANAASIELQHSSPKRLSDFIQSRMSGKVSSSSSSGLEQQQHQAFAGIYFMGTSGWSPYIGGLNPQDTSSSSCGVQRTNVAPATDRVSVGSVCVSPMSFDIDCGFQIEKPLLQGQKGECLNLDYVSTWSQESVFGRCSFSSAAVGGAALAQNIQSATAIDANTNYPRLPKMGNDLENHVNTYWNAMQLGKSNSSTPFAVPTKPYITTQCGEAVSHSIWVGAQKDYQCRLLVGQILKKDAEKRRKQQQDEESGESSSSFVASSDPNTDDLYVCSSAMEGYGFLSAVTRYPQTSNTPAVIIRGASNYDMYPLYQLRQTNNGPLLWLQNDAYITPADEKAFSLAGYEYSIHTTNEVLLNYLATQS